MPACRAIDQLSRKLLKLALTFAALGMVAFLSACPPAMTVQPIYEWENEKQKIDDPGLVGDWISYEGFMSLEIKEGSNTSPANRYWTEFALKATSAGQISKYRAVLVHLGTREFLDVTPEDDDIYQHEFLKHAVVTHTFYRVQRTGDNLRVALFDDEWLKQHIAPQQLIDNGDQLTLTSSTKELQKLLTEHGEDPQAFSQEYHFKRQQTLAEAESLSAVALNHLSHAYLDAGRYEKALTAASRYLELRPENPTGHYQAAHGFLANYQAEQARSELLRWLQLCNDANLDKSWEEVDEDGETDECVDEKTIHQYRGQTYFAEGNYSDAANEFGEYLTSLNNAQWWDLDFIPRYVVALRAHNRAEEIQKLMARTRDKMQPWQQALCSYLQGQLSEADLLKQAESPPGNKQQAYFYIGSFCLISGEKAKAQEMFQKTVAAGSNGSEEAIAARFRLRQLDAK